MNLKYIKLYEDFNESNSKFSISDISKAIEQNKPIYATIIKDYKGNDPKEPLDVVSVDDDGEVCVRIDGNLYYVELKNVENIEL